MSLFGSYYACKSASYDYFPSPLILLTLCLPVYIHVFLSDIAKVFIPRDSTKHPIECMVHFHRAVVDCQRQDKLQVLQAQDSDRLFLSVRGDDRSLSNTKQHKRLKRKPPLGMLTPLFMLNIQLSCLHMLS